MNRYVRQMQLPQIGEAGQSRLAAAHVAVIGAGGLGCPVLQYLAGAGVGRITLFDPDIVELSNLHRQPIYHMADLGRPKVDAARDYLNGFNPEILVNTQALAVGPGLAVDIASKADLVVDAADSFAVSYMLSDACLAATTPLISASVLGQTGYVAGFCGDAPSLRAVFPDLPMSGATCASAGVLGSVVGVIGALQAQIALGHLTSDDPSGLGKMIIADLATYRFSEFGFLGSPEPDIAFPFVAPHMVQNTDLVIELRDQVEAPLPLIDGAMRISQSQIESLVPVPGQRVVLCCLSGLRAWQTANILWARGFDHIALVAAKACT